MLLGAISHLSRRVDVFSLDENYCTSINVNQMFSLRPRNKWVYWEAGPSPGGHSLQRPEPIGLRWNNMAKVNADLRRDGICVCVCVFLWIGLGEGASHLDRAA